jgi:hypothetical protein
MTEQSKTCAELCRVSKIENPKSEDSIEHFGERGSSDQVTVISDQ